MSREKALEKVLRTWMKHETAIAKWNYREWTGSGWIWNDDVWQHNEPSMFAIVEQARAALAMKPTRRGAR